MNLSGPMFEPAKTDNFEALKCLSCGGRRVGAHYNIFLITGGVDALKTMFPDGEADELNFVLFSTSGVHGMYTTIEQIEHSLTKYPHGYEDEDDDVPEDYTYPNLTVLIVHPRIVCLRFGSFDITLEDISYLKKLRVSSHAVVAKIGLEA